MLQLSFKQSKSEIMLRAASTILFNTVERSGCSLLKLSALADKPQYGFTTSASFEVGEFKLVRITDLKNGRINWKTVPYCECHDPKNYLLVEGDLLFARTGATTGKTHLVSHVCNAVFASYLIRLRPKNPSDSKYLYYFFQSDTYWSQILEEKEGSAQPNVNGRKLLNIKVPVIDNTLKYSICNFLDVVRQRQDGIDKDLPELPPPLKQQRRIVARIEELAGKIEEARSLRQKAIEESQMLLHNKLAIIFNKLIEKYGCYTLDELILEAGYGTSAKCTYERMDGSLPVLRIPNVASGYIDYNDIKYGVPKDKELNKALLEMGDLLVVRTNGSADLVGRCSVVSTLPEPTAFASYLIRLRFNNTIVDSDYLQLMLTYIRTDGQLFDLARTTAGQYNVSLGRLRSAKIPIPPIPEQRRIVAYLDNLQAKVEEMKQLREQSLKELDVMLPSILDKAFKGEL